MRREAKKGKILELVHVKVYLFLLLMLIRNIFTIFLALTLPISEMQYPWAFDRISMVYDFGNIL